MSSPESPQKPKKRKRYVPAVGPKLEWLLRVVLGLFALLSVNAVYLGAVTFLEWKTGATYQNYFYQLMFLMHLALGVLLIPTLVIFGVLHILNAHDRPNRRAVRAGYGLFASGLLLIGTGIVLTRLDFFEVRDPKVRSVAYWAHVTLPLFSAWLFVLHRLAGKPIRWRVGASWAAVAAAFALLMVGLHSQDPRQWNVEGPESGEQYFFPSLARTSTGNFIDSDVMMMDEYCVQCHADVHESWAHSAHRFSSFNNPVYLASVRETREVAFERDGDVQAARFCAGCHDPVPFFSGAFDDPNFDDVADPTSQAGITCTSCHAITHVNSPRGNSDYTIEEPAHYPFARSENSLLQWVNRQLVKGKPDFHKKTFLKPLHKSTEFCGTCHKVHLPEELNDYKWLRGQNHYDSFLLSGVSGAGASSFYYPPEAQKNCNGCHMPLMPSDEFGAQDFDGKGGREVHDHMFPSANTGIAQILDMPDWVIEKHRAFNDGVMRLDLFGIKREGSIDGELIAPLRPELPELEPGADYLLETVIRTVKMGHFFTQGTTDSNEIWMEVTMQAGDQLVGISGGTDDLGEVDPWSHFANSYILDREGNRIERRNAQDIFVPLYTHQIPPGAGDVVHYAFRVPEGGTGPLRIRARLLYRKFDSRLMRFVEGEEYDGNDLPVMLLAEDSIELPIAGGPSVAAQEEPDFPLWQRWNDYGIGLLRKGDNGPNRGELRQAEEAFAQVESLGRPDGPLNRARVYFKEGRLDEAVTALTRAEAFDPPAPAWTVAWFTGLVNKQNGFLDDAIRNFQAVVEMDTQETRDRGFDFSRDYRVLTELGQTLVERAKLERGDARREAREQILRQAQVWFERALELDPENVSAHFNLAQLHSDLGDAEKSAEHRALHAKYKPDDNARDTAIATARRNDPAADHAANAVVIYDLQREGAPKGTVEVLRAPESTPE